MAKTRLKYLEFERAIGAPCAYCERPMGVRRNEPWPTKDHEHPRSRGGQRTVWCCSACNNVKGDMTMPEWQAFMAANPEWWKLRPYA